MAESDERHPVSRPVLEYRNPVEQPPRVDPELAWWRAVMGFYASVVGVMMVVLGLLAWGQFISGSWAMVTAAILAGMTVWCATILILPDRGWQISQLRGMAVGMIAAAALGIGVWGISPMSVTLWLIAAGVTAVLAMPLWAVEFRSAMSRRERWEMDWDAARLHVMAVVLLMNAVTGADYARRLSAEESGLAMLPAAVIAVGAILGCVWRRGGWAAGLIATFAACVAALPMAEVRNGASSMEYVIGTLAISVGVCVPGLWVAMLTGRAMSSAKGRENRQSQG